MGNFQSSSSRIPDEEEVAYPNLQNQYKSNGRSVKIVVLLYFGSIYRATKALLQKLCVVFNYLRPRETADPLLPIQDPPSTALVEPLLAPPSTSDDSSSHSTFKIPHGSLTDSIDDEEAQFENIIWSDEIVEETTAPCVVGIKSREEEERAVEVIVKRSIVVVKTIKHYSSRHEILLVGDGDFSFSASLAVAFGSAANITATSLNSEAFLKKHYGNAMANVAELRGRGSKVMHGIDATKISKHKLLRELKFDRIIFNFPHAGFSHKLSEESQLRRHRKLVSRFLMNARKMISENGEIHITHKTNGRFHAEFKLESIASSHGLRLIKAVKFNRSDYPGYNTKYGFGGDKNFDCNPSKTFKFGPKMASV